MNIITAFFWILFYESIPNFFALSGIVNMYQEWKKKRPVTMHVLGIFAAILCVLSMALLEARKVSVTTLAAPTEAGLKLPVITAMALIFYAFMYVFMRYFGAQKSSAKLDIILGLTAAVVLSAIEIALTLASGDVQVIHWQRILSHTIAFLIAFPLTLLGLRKTIAMPEGKGMWWLLGTTMVMSVLITLVDYMPFVKR